MRNEGEGLGFARKLFLSVLNRGFPGVISHHKCGGTNFGRSTETLALIEQTGKGRK
ncbi:MAG: hypothetical protein Ct9H300mP28_08580 [Pseudomonadota bacterium]|nr:MAG: hypothetical protein Ct9H300mP28_08580 [Pseudomonadota bacterium]